MADDEDQDDEPDIRAPIRDESGQHEMLRRIDKLERWQIAADIMIKENSFRLSAIDSHISAEFKEQNAEIKQRFEELSDKLEAVITDQKMWQVVRSVFKWIAIVLGPVIGAAWAVSTFIYDHYHGHGGK